MSLSGILWAVGLIGGIGLFVGLFLGVAAIKFKVSVDEREEQITRTLPGNNCGGCGYPGCSGLAAAIVKNEAKVNACPVGGETVAQAIAQIMGVEAESVDAQVAFVKCSGDCSQTQLDYEYIGTKDCRMLKFVPNGGPKSCNHGCLGFGTCVKACPFDAIHIVNGIAKVDSNQCKACGKCVAVCPNHLIELIPKTATQVVACASKDKGPVVMKACKTGCIGCGICVKQCEHEAIQVQDFCARIDQEKCVGCGACVEKCPRKIIETVHLDRK